MTDTIETLGDAPAWLDAEGRAIWHIAAPELRRQGLLTPSEETAFARYCYHVARWLKLRERVNGRGETYETESKHGKLQRINPDLNAMMQIERSIESLEDRFALTPLMRFKLKEIRSRAEGERLAPSGLLPLYDADEAENSADSAVAANAPAVTPFGILN
jgi:P27 family predicted phage terminase small subunit